MSLIYTQHQALCPLQQRGLGKWLMNNCRTLAKLFLVVSRSRAQENALKSCQCEDSHSAPPSDILVFSGAQKLAFKKKKKDFEVEKKRF